MTSVFVVGRGDCESFCIVSIHRTREKALAVWNEQRLELLQKAREMLEWCKFERKPESSTQMYEREIRNLEETDPEKMDNYPHDCVSLLEYELED